MAQPNMGAMSPEQGAMYQQIIMMQQQQIYQLWLQMQSQRMFNPGAQGDAQMQPPPGMMPFNMPQGAMFPGGMAP